MALKYNDGHICKRNPTDIVEFCLESTDREDMHFRGILKVQLSVTKLIRNVLMETEASQSKENQQESVQSQNKYTRDLSVYNIMINLPSQQRQNDDVCINTFSLFFNV